MNSAPPLNGKTTSRRSWRRYAVIGVAAVAGLGVLGNAVSPPVDDPASVAQSTPTPTTTTPASTTAAPTVTVEPSPTVEALTPSGPTATAEVTRVVDGDTVVVDIDGREFRLRYIGMDSPETNAKDADVRAMAEAATEANRALVDGRQVVLERDVSETDRFGRLLRNVWIKGPDGTLMMVGLELVRTGFAQVSTYPPDVKYVDLLTEAQASAKTAGVGLWAPAPTPTPAPTSIVSADPVEVADAYTFKGARQTYHWSDVTLLFEVAKYKVTGTAGSNTSCKVTWNIANETHQDGFTLKVSPKTKKSQSRTYDPAIAAGALTVNSTCPAWQITVSEYVPPPPKLGVYGNPYGFDFKVGKKIYDPPGDICSYIDCITSFWDSTNGYVVQCVDGRFSHSGGRPGVCFRHGGYRRTLYQH